MTKAADSHRCPACTAPRVLRTHTTVSTVYKMCGTCGHAWHEERGAAERTSMAFRISTIGSPSGRAGMEPHAAR